LNNSSRTATRLRAPGRLASGPPNAPSYAIVESGTNPIQRLTRAIHVYGGDFFAAERSEWNPETLTE